MKSNERYLETAALCCAAVLLSCAVFDGALSWLARVSFPFCLVVWLCIFRERNEALAGAVLCGLLMDLCSMPPWPVNSVVFILYFFAAFKLGDIFYSRASLANALAQCMLMCALSGAEYCLLMLPLHGVYPSTGEAAAVFAANTAAVCIAFIATVYRGRKFRSFSAGALRAGVSSRM